MDLETLLWDAVDRGVSDLHLRAGSPPMLSLYQRELISEEVAVAAATVPSNLKLALAGIVSGLDAGRGRHGASPSRSG
jgi:Tfp pilus assembly pilus retraction ATPase PilT